MKTDLTLSSAKSSFGWRTQKYAIFLVLIVCLTLLILKTSAQLNVETNEEVELRKAKLRSLLARPPLNVRKTNAQQPSKKLNDNTAQSVTTVTTSKSIIATTTTNNQTATSSKPPTVSKGNTVGNENQLVAFLESLRAASKLNATKSVIRAKDTSLNVDGCNFEQESGTLECKNDLEFFDLNLAFAQTINLIHNSNNNQDSDGNGSDYVGKTMQL